MKWYILLSQIINVPLMLIILARFRFNIDRATNYIDKVSQK